MVKVVNFSRILKRKSRIINRRIEDFIVQLAAAPDADDDDDDGDAEDRTCAS